MELAQLKQSVDGRRQVIWHDLECGRYEADLPLWRRLADEVDTGEEILEVGAGTGRVALDLAARGHRVTALDNDRLLLAALEERAEELPVRTVCADARDFELAPREFALCLVAMQTLQLLGGERGRGLFFRAARRHLRPGAKLACAVATGLESFDCVAEGLRPVPEIARVGSELYCSEAVRVSSSARHTRIERERIVAKPGGIRERERHAIDLDSIQPSALEREARAVGLEPIRLEEIPATSDYAASVALTFRA